MLSTYYYFSGYEARLIVTERTVFCTKNFKYPICICTYKWLTLKSINFKEEEQLNHI
jgi:hypothetical protein